MTPENTTVDLVKHDQAVVERPVVDDTEPEKRSRLRLLGLVLLPVLVVALAVAYGLVHWKLDRAESAADARAQVSQIASDGAVAILSYTPDSVDQDLTEARSRLTGDFLDYYTKFTTDVVAPAAKEKKIATAATAEATGVASVDGSTAVVLVFVNQTTTAGDGSQPTDSASSVRVELQKVDGSWLIDKFDPV